MDGKLANKLGSIGETTPGPCSFCGGEAQPTLVQAGGIEWAQVECLNRECGAVGPTPGSEAEAIRLWNTRAPILSQAEQIERLTVAGQALVEAIDQMIEDTAPIFAEMELGRDRPYTGKQIGGELEAFRSVLAGARATTWRPISEAPKDGTPLLLFARCKTATASAPVIGWHLPEEGWIELCFTPNNPVGIVPSHWMPLPPVSTG